METSSDRDYQDRRVGPTVSKEKWINHAKTKMSRGYELVVGNERRTANFYQRDKGFEMCPYNIAKQLIKDGIVIESGRHPLGTKYKLSEEYIQVEPPPKRKKTIIEEPAEEEVDPLLGVAVPVVDDVEDEDVDDIEDDEDLDEDGEDEEEDDVLDDEDLQD